MTRDQAVLRLLQTHLSPQERGVLRAVAEGTGTPADVGRLTGLSTGQASVVLGRVRDKGYVYSPSTRRGYRRYTVLDPDVDRLIRTL